MAGLTIVHLSDLHVGKGLEGTEHVTAAARRFSLEKQGLAREAERLTNDFLYLRDAVNVPFRTEEILLVVTGDITHACQWQQYELALWFFQEVRRLFTEKFRGQSIPSGRILAIPGNHDVNLPRAELGEKCKAGVDKYRDFKLFLDILTDYAPYARRFRPSIGITDETDLCEWQRTSFTTKISITVPGPLKVSLVDLDSCMGVNCLCRSGKHPDAGPGFSEDGLKAAAQIFASSTGAIRIGLMHHSLADLPSQPDDPTRIDQSALEAWCIVHGVKLLLTGHTHRQSGGGRLSEEGADRLMARTTGPTLPHGNDDRGCAYQVIRLESHAKPYTYPRELIPRRDDLFWESARGTDNKQRKSIGLTWTELTEGIAPVVPNEFLGCSAPGEWAVISHCESGKFQNYGILSPGETINAALIRHFHSPRGNLVKAAAGYDVEYPPGSSLHGKHTTAWSLFDKKCVFLVDSPRYNRYVAWVLDHYSGHMAGGRVTFRDNTTDSPHTQEIVVCGQTFKPARPEWDSLFGGHRDYLLIMRLPGLVPSTPVSVENRSCPDFDKTIWVVAGIHSKASQAGAILFTPENLPSFIKALTQQCHGETPAYFEAVYEIPTDSTRPLRGDRDLGFLNAPKHLRLLQPKTQVAMADGQPSAVAARFRSGADWSAIPLEVVHLDPVAACNFCCSDCIERPLREQKSFLSLSTCLDVLYDLKTVGCRQLNLYGGEPTLHPEFPQLLRTICSMGFETLIVTNGSRLHESEIAQSLIDCRRNVQLRVSLDACCDETHRASHGLKNPGSFSTIVSAVKRMIREGLHTTVSFLLHPHVIACTHFREVCEEWEREGAHALILRPVTGTGGHSPKLEYNESSVEKILGILDDLGARRGFAHTRGWFERALRNGGGRPHSIQQPKPYQTCFSAYYRMVISPHATPQLTGERTVCGVKMAEVSNAWLSWCSYRRNIACEPEKTDGEGREAPKRQDQRAAFGVDYPKDLALWLRRDRLAALESIDPSLDCKDVCCCRHDLNKELHELLA